MTKVERTIPKQVLSKRRKYFKSIKSMLKNTFFLKGQLVCAVCGAETSLELHHIMPLAMGGSNDIDNLMVLCHEHHEQIHNGGGC
jgi:5-methylcytosine-specific restriction endonuclease McrA